MKTEPMQREKNLRAKEKGKELDDSTSQLMMDMDEATPVSSNETAL